MLKHEILPVTPYQQNCSLIWCDETGDAAVIDPGGEVDRIEAMIARRQVQLRKILLTHGHLDHVGGTAELHSRTGVPVVGPHRDDLFWISMLDQQTRMMGFAPVAQFEPDQWLQDGDRIALGKLVLQVLHCPGHTPGHVVFYEVSARLAFVGDVLFHGSIGRTDFPRGDRETLINAIKTQLWPLGDDVTFVPGHGPLSTFGEERRHNPYVAD